MPRRLHLAALLGAASLALAACGGTVATSAPTTAPATEAPATPTAATPAPATDSPSATPEAVPSATPEAARACEPVDAPPGIAARIRGFTFPTGLSVKAGESITWDNADAAPHTVTFDDGTCASGSIGPGASVTVRYDTAGTFAFHCAIHPSMTGTLVVEP